MEMTKETKDLLRRELMDVLTKHFPEKSQEEKERMIDGMIETSKRFW